MSSTINSSIAILCFFLVSSFNPRPSRALCQLAITSITHACHGNSFFLHWFATAVDNSFSASERLCFLFPVKAVYARQVSRSLIASTKAPVAKFGAVPCLIQPAILFRTRLWSSLSCCGSPPSSSSGTYRRSLKLTPAAVKSLTFF